MSIHRSFLAAGMLAAVAGCSSSSSGSHSPSFSDVSAAPPAIQAAAHAVVRIVLAEEAVTGSFISPDGKLLTNNHVLGVGECPIEGCTVKLSFDYQRGVPVSTAQTVFVVPLAVDIGLDMALVQVYQSKGGAPLSTPSYLTIDSRDAASLQGTHVHVVGHPEAHLKKWTQGEVVDSSGTWIQFSAYSLPGNSGSPVLDDAGHMVGILHRGPTVQDLFTSTGADEYSIGTASAALVSAMSAPLPSVMWSLANSTTDDVVAQNESVYLNAQTPMANVNGAPKLVVDSLGVACDEGLAAQDIASPEDLSAALAPCFAAENWINCGGISSGAPFTTCPADTSGWANRYQQVFDRFQALNGDLELSMVSFAPAALQTSGGQAFAAGLLQQAVTNANPPLDFNLAAYLVAFGIRSYAGTDLPSFVINYKSYPDYGLWGDTIDIAILWLNSGDVFSGSQSIALLQQLYADPTVDISSRLYIEETLYQSGVLN